METGSDDGARGDFRRAAANDNPGSRAGAGPGPEARIEDAVMRLARLLGRQIAREHFQRSRSAPVVRCASSAIARSNAATSCNACASVTLRSDW